MGKKQECQHKNQEIVRQEELKDKNGKVIAIRYFAQCLNADCGEVIDWTEPVAQTN